MTNQTLKSPEPMDKLEQLNKAGDMVYELMTEVRTDETITMDQRCRAFSRLGNTLCQIGCAALKLRRHHGLPQGNVIDSTARRVEEPPPAKQTIPVELSISLKQD